MSWTLLIGLVLALAIALIAAWARRGELARMQQHVRERADDARSTSAGTLLQQPIVDLSRCLGCGTCVSACPEGNVLELVHGQAAVVHGARCVGHAVCERECPVGAITVTLANLSERRDVPVLSDALEAVGTPGLFLAGEVTAQSLIKSAIEQGRVVAREVARRVEVARANSVTQASMRLSTSTSTSTVGRLDARVDSVALPAARVAATHELMPTAALATHARGGSTDVSAWLGALDVATAGESPSRASSPRESPRATADAAGNVDVLDLCIVGAGPAGLACSLEARRLGLSFVTLDQEEALGGTVRKYPRRKLVLTQPVDLPLAGGMHKSEYSKEELIELWQRVAGEHELAIRHGERVEGIEHAHADHHVVRTARASYAARHVCLALGRRGTPNRLGVPGEELAKVAYGLLDARSYHGRRIAVIGGGDSAIEAALALVEQRDNEVTLVHRRDAFPRLRARNAERLSAARAAGLLRVETSTRVVAIHASSIELASAASEHAADHERDGNDERDETDARGERFERRGQSERGAGAAQAPTRTLANDDVLVLIGGAASQPLLERAGVSFDPALRAPSAPPAEQGTGLLPALAIGLALALLALGFALWNSDYYALPMEARPTAEKHAWLRPSRALGLVFAIASCAAIAVNLAYLARRAQRFGLRRGSLSAWMTAHVATGVLAFLCALLHGAMAPRDTAGGHAFASLAVLLVTGAIGRYVYAWVPRAANGRELALDEVQLELERLTDAWRGERRAFASELRTQVIELARARQWKGSLLGRLWALAAGQRELGALVARARAAGAAAGVDAAALRELERLARRAYRHALAAAHYEDLRALLSSWRYLHRWVAVLMVVLMLMHALYALTYGSLLDVGGVP